LVFLKYFLRYINLSPPPPAATTTTTTPTKATAKL
jgi:hypothetical protein